MWPVLWQTAALAAIVGLVALCARRMSPAQRFWLWMLVPLRLLVMPLVTVTLPVLANSAGVQPPALIAPPGVVSRNDLIPAPPEWAAEPVATAPVAAFRSSVSVSLRSWLMIAWAAGVCLFSLRLGRGWLRMRAIAARARDNTDARVRDCAREAAAMLGLRKLPKIMTAAEGVSPFVTGFLHPAVVLPAALADHVSPEGLRTVLAHEFAHVRRRDALLGWVLACSDVIYFFNPVVHLVKRAILFERERACDEQVLALAQAARAVYARALLSVVALNCDTATGLSCAPVLLESGQHLERRLKSIADERRPCAVLSRTARLAMLAIMCIALPGVTLTARSATAPAAPAPSSSREVPGGSVSAGEGAELRTYDLAIPEDWKSTLSVGKFSVVGLPFYGVPWNFGLWTCIRVEFPLKNLTAVTQYVQVNYRTKSKLEGCGNTGMGACYTLGPGEERLIEAIAPIASTERPIQFLLRMERPVQVPPTSEAPEMHVAVSIDPLPVAKPPMPGEKIDIVKGNAEHFAVEEVRLEYAKEKGNLFVMVARNKTDKALPLVVFVAVNDPRNVENNISPVEMDDGSFANQVTTVAAGREATVSLPYEVRAVGEEPLLAFSIFEPRPEYATYGEGDRRIRDVTLVAWGTANLVKAAERGECVMPPAAAVAGAELVRKIRALPWRGAGNAAVAAFDAARQPAGQLADGRLWLKLGLALYDGRYYAQALEAFRAAAENSRDNPTNCFGALVWQGHMLDLLHRRDEALQLYKEALAITGYETLRHDQYGMKIDRAWVEERLRTPFEIIPPAVKPAEATTAPEQVAPGVSATPAEFPQKETTNPSGRRPTGNCAISGKVVSDATGEPVPKAKVYLFYFPTYDALFIEPASDGSFEFKNIPAGRYAMQVIAADGYQDQQYDPENLRRPGHVTDFALKENEQRKGILFRLKPAYKITGRVLDENGIPPADSEGMEVMALEQETAGGNSGVNLKLVRQAAIAKDGAYSIDGLDGRPALLMVIDDRANLKDNAYPPCYYPGTFSQDAAEKISFEKGPSVANADIHLKRAGGLALEGKVTDESTGEPVPRALLVVWRTDTVVDRVFAYADSRGRFRLDCFGPGDFQIDVDAAPAGFVRTRKAVAIQDASPIPEVNFALKHGTTLSGRFVNEQGKELPIIRDNSYGGAYSVDPHPAGSGWSFSTRPCRNKYSPESLATPDLYFIPGEGEYWDAHMLFPTPRSFLIQGMTPGKTHLFFNPLTVGKKVAKILYQGADVLSGGIQTKPGERIEGIEIVIADEGPKTR
jgi:beta-lactamase regulating signal transducer with metallopeptidase domain/tetratricopeptide (TPR) repeat protein